MQSDALMEILNKYWSNHGDLYIHPQIPKEKLSTASLSCKIPQGEKVIGLIDCTIFGEADDAIVFGNNGVYIHNEFMDNSLLQFPYSDFVKTKFRREDEHISVNDFKCIAIGRSIFKLEDLLSILLDIKDLTMSLQQNN